ncbi:MAG TPA: hypothetical protein VIM47_01110, partial [Dermatophilaceae bacterium]
MTNDRAITTDLMVRLRRHYIKPGDPLPGGIFVPEVGFNGGGTRRCDAIYVGFTGASGRQLIGHEVKASRADWLTELAKPGKADAWADQCHAWWIVAAPGVVKLDELPNGWGLLEPGPKTRTRMVVRAHATNHPERVPSWLAVRSVMSRFDTLRAETIGAARSKAHQDATAQVDERVDLEVEYRMRGRADAVALQAKLDQIEKALGATIDVNAHSWCPSGTLTLTDLTRVGDAARAGRKIHEALAELARPYHTPLATVRGQLDRLQAALDACQDLAVATVG